MSNSPKLRDFTGLRAELVELTSRLVAFRSSRSRPEQVAACADFIRGWLAGAGIAYSLHENQGVPSIMVGAGLAGASGYEPVLLLTHFDVVDGRDDQFEARLDGDWLVGRGSLDDKYAVALSLLLYREMAAGGAAPKFGLLMTGDEESGGRNGAGAICRQVSYRTEWGSGYSRHPDQPKMRPGPEFCIALDGGGPKALVTRQKGVLRLSLTEQGVTMYGTHPLHGDNAAVKLLRDCLAVVRYFNDMGSRDEQATAPAAWTAGGLALPRDYWYPTCNLGSMRAGEAVNRVPDFASAQFDIRYTEKDDPKALFAAVQGITGGEVELVINIPPLRHLESDFIEDLLFCAPGADFAVGYGASDVQYFSSCGIPCVIWGAEGNNSQHGDDERMFIPSALDVMRRLECFLRDL